MAEYQRISGLSYATVNHLCNTRQLQYITTESGLRRIDTTQKGADNSVILEKLDAQERMLKALCKQFNTGVTA
jgi:hypothetical protein